MTLIALQNRMARIEINLTQGHAEYLDMLNEYVALYLKLQKGRYENDKRR